MDKELFTEKRAELCKSQNGCNTGCPLYKHRMDVCVLNRYPSSSYYEKSIVRTLTQWVEDHEKCAPVVEK